jgi:hypothetical protein
MSSFKFNGRRWSFAGAVLVLVGAGAVLGGGCGGADIDLSTLSNFCQALAQADCSPAVVTACYGAGDTTIDVDTQSCITTRSAPEQCNPGGLPYHADQAQACIDAHTAAYANSQLAASDLQNVEQACLPVFNKSGQAGGVCTQDSDCDAGSGLSCVIHLSKGTCEIPNTVEAGSECVDPAAQCADGNYCEAGNHCVSDPSAGEVCGSGIPCDMGLRCDGTSNTCKAQLPDQADCTANGDCTGGICVPTSSTASKCFATYIFAADSPTCAPFVSK